MNIFADILNHNIMAKFSISFSVNEDVYNRCKQMFPAGRNQEVLVDLLDAYESREQNSTANEKSNELVNAILELYSCSENELIDVCKSHLSTENELENKVSQLENERIRLEDERIRLENDGIRLEDERKSLENKIFQLENERIQMENNGIRLENERISLENEDIWLKIKRNITPFSAYLLENTAEKLSARYNKDVKPLQILIDMFMRYTIEKWSQWFYPFVLSDKEILEIAQQINPEIKNINEIKKTLPK